MTDFAASALDQLIAFVREHLPLLALVAIALAVRWPAIQWRLPDAVKPTRACAAAFVVALLWVASPALIHGMPLPWMHDDYSSLLGGELVAEGRTSMPAHPMWRHFEAMHQLQQPRRASKYPPGQQLILGAGIAAGAQPIVAEWLITALAAAAICWAALAWMSGGAALVTGLVAAVHPATLEFGEAYRGGGLAALAGALVIGATGRLRGSPRARDGVIFGLGAALLAVTRPYEGLVLTAACGLIALRRWKTLLYAAPAVIAALAALALWNRSVTGDALVMPYAAYERQYAGEPPLAFERAKPQPPIGNREMETMYRVYAGQVRRAREHPVIEVGKKLADVANFWLGIRDSPIVLLPLIGLAALAWRNADMRALLAVAAVFILGLLFINGWLLPHYLAPFAAAAWILLVAAVLALPEVFGHRRGPVLAIVVVALFVASAANAWWTWARGREPYHERERRAIEASLRANGRPDLILVPPDVFDVVYNHADIDAQDVVWARDLGPAANAALLRYYSGRNVWTLGKRADGGLQLLPHLQAP